MGKLRKTYFLSTSPILLPKNYFYSRKHLLLNAIYTLHLKYLTLMSSYLFRRFPGTYFHIDRSPLTYPGHGCPEKTVSHYVYDKYLRSIAIFWYTLHKFSIARAITYNVPALTTPLSRTPEPHSLAASADEEVFYVIEIDHLPQTTWVLCYIEVGSPNKTFSCYQHVQRLACLLFYQLAVSLP